MAEQESARNGARNRGGVQRVEGKLRASVEKGDYYEAHQMYRTLFFRYMSQGRHAEARELMVSGALLFFSHGQQNSAADLSMLVLESLEKAEVEVADELLENLAKLFSLMDPNSPERVAFVSRALKWSSGGSGKLGHPRLHQLLALTLWKEQNYCESRYHFLHSADGEGCAHMLVEYSTARGFRSEVDMFVAQAVLQFLCLKNKSSASVVFTTYTQKHPSIENGPPFVQPLLNFIWFLLLAVDGGKLTVFTVLCEQYQPSLRRDPMYNEYLDRIGQLFFGVPPKQTSSYGGLLASGPQEMVDWFNALRAARFHYLQVAFPGASDADLVPKLSRNYLKEGYMEKTGPKHTEGFRKRWFTMDDRRLMYFKDPLDAFARGEVFIGSRECGYAVLDGLPPSTQGHHWPHGITIVTPERRFLLACETESERRAWAAAFRKVVDRPMLPQEYAVEAHFKHKP